MEKFNHPDDSIPKGLQSERTNDLESGRIGNSEFGQTNNPEADRDKNPETIKTLGKITLSGYDLLSPNGSDLTSPPQESEESERPKRLETALDNRQRQLIINNLSSDESRFNLDAWLKVYSADELQKDAKYVKGLRSKFESGHNLDRPAPASKVFERLINSGINNDAWLGNIDRGDGPAFVAESDTTSPYDDFRNRSDSVVTIIRPEKPTLKFALDVTVNSHPYDIAEKLTRSTNSDAPLPFGATELKYPDPTTPSKKMIVPRFNVNFDTGLVRGLEEQGTTENNSRTYGNAASTRFKLLAQLYLQSNAFEKLSHGANDPSVKRFNRQVASLRRIFADALNEHLASLFSYGEFAKQFLDKNVADWRKYQTTNDRFKLLSKLYCEPTSKNEEDDKNRNFRVTRSEILSLGLLPPELEPMPRNKGMVRIGESWIPLVRYSGKPSKYAPHFVPAEPDNGQKKEIA